MRSFRVFSSANDLVDRRSEPLARGLLAGRLFFGGYRLIGNRIMVNPGDTSIYTYFPRCPVYFRR